MKRFLITFLCILFLPMTVYAETDEAYRQQLDSYDFSFFEDTLGNEAYDMLRELGVDDFSYDKLYSLQLEDFLKLLKGSLTERLKAPLEGLLAVLVFVLLSSFFTNMKSESSSVSELFSTVSALVISSLLIIKMSNCLSLAGASLRIVSDFMYAFVPVFAAIVAASGGITASFSTNSMLLILSQGLSLLQSQLFFPLINCFLAIGICSGLKAELHLHRVISTAKRVITGLISFTSGLFISVLSLKTTVASRADMLGIRGLRFVITSVVPVVGAAISEGLLSIQTYSSMIKTSVGIVGIIAVILVFLPSVISVLCWRAVLTLGLLAADVFNDQSVRLTLTAFSDALLLINVILIVSALTVTVSLGILVAANTPGG